MNDPIASKNALAPANPRVDETDLSKHLHAPKVPLEDPMPLSEVLDELMEQLRETRKD